MATQVLGLPRPRRAPLTAVQRHMMLALALGLALIGATLMLHREAGAASDGLAAARAQLGASIRQARAAGFSEADLSAATAAYDAPAAIPPITLFLDGAALRENTRLLTQASHDLPAQLAEAMARRRAAVAPTLDHLRSLIDEADRAGAVSSELKAARDEAAGAPAALAAATSPRDLAAAVARLEKSAQGLTQLIAEIRDDEVRIDSAAAAMAAQPGVDLDQTRAVAAATVRSANDDATVAAFLGIGDVAPLLPRLEHYGALAGAGDPGPMFHGAAGVRLFADRIHSTLVGKLPHKTIVVSIAAQHLWAYESGRTVQDTLVTTGRPMLDTDVGPMRVLHKDAPWKMHSPWPRSSPYWYPDATVNQVLWFTDTGEGLHDAYWQPPGTYGPGSQFGPSASHGCIHVPDASEHFLFDWADIGTPVVVIPGDGSPVDVQVTHRTVGPDGQPFSGARGA